MSTTMTSTLRGLMASLPQEIYDEIYDLTFTPNSTITLIQPWYRPANEGQVSRATRQKFKEALHRGTFVGQADVILFWIGKLSYEERCKMALKICCWVLPGPRPSKKQRPPFMPPQLSGYRKCRARAETFARVLQYRTSLDVVTVTYKDLVRCQEAFLESKHLCNVWAMKLGGGDLDMPDLGGHALDVAQFAKSAG